MSDEPVHDAGYTHAELRVIFERAGKLEIVSSTHERRYSLAEIQEMGAQAGLREADVARAAASIRNVSFGGRLLGAPTRFRAATSVNHRLSQTGLADVVEKIREVTGRHGNLRLVPTGVEWRARGALGAYIVDFRPGRQSTRIGLLIARDDEAAVAMIGAVVGSFMFGVIGGLIVGFKMGVGPLPGIGIGIATTGVTLWGAARVWWHYSSRRWKERLDHLIGVITTAAAAAEPEGDRINADQTADSGQK